MNKQVPVLVTRDMALILENLISLVYDNSGILNSKGIIQEISRDSLQDKCTMYNRSLMRQNVLETCVKIFSYLFHFNGNIRLSSQSSVAVLTVSYWSKWFLSLCVGVDYDRWSLSPVSLSGVITNTEIQRQ